MPRASSRWVFWIFIGVMCVLLLLFRSLWQPWFFGTVLPRQQKLELIRSVFDILLGAGIIPSLYKLYLFLFPPPPPPEKLFSLETILKPTSYDLILKDYIDKSGKEIRWIDRGVVTPGDLPGNPRLVIIGRMKMGKTREAAELIRRALADG